MASQAATKIQSVLIENIPAALRALPQWVCWKYEVREDEDKPTKVPFNARTGKRAKSNNPETWVNFDHACAALENGSYDGIGFVVTEDCGIVGGDLDHCIDTTTGELQAWADKIIQQADTYTETTPSGEGMRFFARGVLPAGGRKSGNVEIYSHGRFLTMTGRHWPGTPTTVEERTAAIAAIHAEHFAAEEATPAPALQLVPPVAAGQDTDDARLQLAFGSASGSKIRDLWAGNWQAHYSSQSEADSALCFHLAFWFNKDTSRVDEMFRKSGLMRDKWDKVHHNSGETYGQKTVGYAVAQTKECYTPPRTLPAGFLQGNAAREYISGDVIVEPEEESTEKHPYSIKGGRMFFVIEKVTKQGVDTTFNVIADLVAHITEEITTEEGGRSFKIEGRSAPHKSHPRGRAFSFEIAADDFADEKRLKAALTDAAGAQSAIRKGMAGHLAPAIQLLTGDLIQARRFARTGWLEGENTFLIPGREPEHATIELPRKLPYSISPDARLEDGLTALESLLLAQHTPLAIVATTIAFQAPLAARMRWRNERYAMFIAGRTGSLKSSWSQVLMTLYGPGFVNDDQLVKWGEGATRNAIMSFATHAHDLPMLIDNYKPSTGGGERDFVNLIHNILEGGEKDRLNRAAQMRSSKPVFAWPIVTGEDVPDSDAASLARVLVVPFPFPGGNENPALTKAQSLAGHMCAVGAAWLDWITSLEAGPIIEDMAARFPDRRTGWTARLRRIRPDMVNLNRVASNLASNELTWQTMGLCPVLAPLVQKFSEQQQAGLSTVAGEMATQTAQSLEASRYLNALRELLASEKYILMPKDMPVGDRDQDRLLGWRDEHGIYLLPSIARQAVERLLGINGLGGLSDQTLYKQLDSLGAIASHDADRMTKTARVAGNKQRVLHFRNQVFEDE